MFFANTITLYSSFFAFSTPLREYWISKLWNMLVCRFSGYRRSSNCQIKSEALQLILWAKPTLLDTFITGAALAVNFNH